MTASSKIRASLLLATLAAAAAPGFAAETLVYTAPAASTA
jgi:hypothetical protein